MSRIQTMALVGMLSMIPSSVLAQTSGGATSAPVTAWGHLDLQGVWDFRTMTPLQRPTSQVDKPFLTEEEAVALETGIKARRTRLLEPNEVRTEPLPAGGGGLAVGGYNDFWLDYGTNVIGDRRTSLIIDPPDGRLPPLTPKGEALHTASTPQSKLEN